MLISNNPYELRRLGGFGTRERMDTGLLGITTISVASTAEAAQLTALGLAGQLDRFGGYDTWTAASIDIEADVPVATGIDGEFVRLDPPVRFSIRPACLRVRLARHAPQASPAAAAAAGGHRDGARALEPRGARRARGVLTFCATAERRRRVVPWRRTSARSRCPSTCAPPTVASHPDARGWSRVPLHRCNLRGRFGRNKRWDYWGILAGDLAISSTFSNVDYLGIVDVWWGDLATGRTGGRGVTVPFPRGIRLPERPGTAPLRYSSRHLTVEMLDDAARDRPARHVGGARRHTGSARRAHRAAGGTRIAQRGDPVVGHHVPVHVQAPGPSGARRARRR